MDRDYCCPLTFLSLFLLSFSFLVVWLIRELSTVTWAIYFANLLYHFHVIPCTLPVHVVAFSIYVSRYYILKPTPHTRQHLSSPHLFTVTSLRPPLSLPTSSKVSTSQIRRAHPHSLIEPLISSYHIFSLSLIPHFQACVQYCTLRVKTNACFHSFDTRNQFGYVDRL